MFNLMIGQRSRCQSRWYVWDPDVNSYAESDSSGISTCNDQQNNFGETSLPIKGWTWCGQR